MSLRILCILAAMMVSSAALQAAESAYRNVNVGEFEQLRTDKSRVVLDVRTAKEFAAGHIPGAVHLDVNAADFMEKAAKLEKSKTYLIHCAAGGRSVTACKKLGPAGFTNLVNLEGGFKAWKSAKEQKPGKGEVAREPR